MIDTVREHPLGHETAVLQANTPEQLVKHLIAAANSTERHFWLDKIVPTFDKTRRNHLANLLKKQADRNLRINLENSTQFADLMERMGELCDDVRIKALSYRARGNIHALGYGDHPKGIAFYEQAADIYRRLGMVYEEALSQTGKIWSLASLGQADEALNTGKWASSVLTDEKDWPALAVVTMNMGIIYGRLGNDQDALQQFNRAFELSERLDQSGKQTLPMIRINQAIVLRNLGRFDESIESLQQAMAGYHANQQIVGVARAQQNLAITYFVLGRYNEAMALLDEARTTYLADGRQRDAMMVEIFTSDCLLQLRRYTDVLEKCRECRQIFAELGTQLEMGHAFLNEAIAYVGLQDYDAALNSLAQARAQFQAENNEVAIADTDLQEAAVWLWQGKIEAALQQALRCAKLFETYQLPIGQARAYLTAAKAAMQLSNLAEAANWAHAALQIGQRHTLPALNYQAQYLQGSLASKQNAPQLALARLDAAIQELEQMYGRLMIEFRADFVADKEQIYEDAVSICLELQQPEKGLEYCERAKSRALQDMLAHRLNLRIEARSPEDQPIVDKLLSLRRERDRLYRRWATSEEPGQRGGADEALSAQHRVGQAVLDLEKQITTLWHTLLIRNADYARDATLWQVQTMPAQPHLPENCLLLEYFSVRGQLVLFLVTQNAVEAFWLEGNMQQVQNLLQLFQLNIKAVAKSNAAQIKLSVKNIQGILHKLYQILLEPIATKIANYEKLIVIPHGSLHYLPFHALYDGREYLIQSHELSYLPGSSMLGYSQSATNNGNDHVITAVGSSYEGRLPHAVTEASNIAERWQGKAIIEKEASLKRVKQAAEQSTILHLATHGDFRPDSPLFSGLVLADGWLTTLDIFNLRLRASLVTLSACQTGRSVVGGGDELLGLMRAFLSAGAASLVSTLWAVEDSSTAVLMNLFYEAIANNHTKGTSLRLAQLHLLTNGDYPAMYQHPYFWAPFFLVGNAGPL
ncbi:CHAT domain-containing protein [Candidatus Leptofilum sp.]|uniref:CHAT domain-containing protein n=1 Tax=Candidatus Leptofilum sp. TaxID=3241576 RepID=UPI003B5A9B16